MIKRISVEKVAVVILCSVALLGSIMQTIAYWMRTKPGFVYPWVHNFEADFYWYLSLMRQGYDGWWLVTTRMSPEGFPRVLVSPFLLFLGHLSRVLGTDTALIYTISRIFGGGVLMILAYQLIRRTFPQSRSKRLTALFFVLFGTFFWGWQGSMPTVSSLVRGWTELDPWFRWSFVPHHLWSKAGMVAAFLLLVSPARKTYHISLITIIILMGFTNPVVYATFVPTLILYWMLRQDHAAIVAIGAAVAVLLYHRGIQTHIFPWTNYLVWEKTLTYSVHPLAYIQSLGPTFLLFVIALPAMLKMGKTGALLVSWGASSWVMLFLVGRFLPVTMERYLGGYQFVPYGIGAAAALGMLRPKALQFGAVIFLCCYVAVGLFASFQNDMGYVKSNRDNRQIYLPASLMDAFSFLDTHGKPEDVVMAPVYESFLIPAFSDKRVLAGHPLFTRDMAEKHKRIALFFSHPDGPAAKSILLENKVAWILSDVSWQPFDFLTSVYRSGPYAVYRL